MKFYQALIAVSLVALASAENQTPEFSNIQVLASKPNQIVNDATNEAKAKLDEKIEEFKKTSKEAVSELKA